MNKDIDEMSEIMHDQSIGIVGWHLNEDICKLMAEALYHKGFKREKEKP